MPRRWKTALCGVMFLAAAALAVAAAPDLSTPRATAKSLYLAVQQADAQAIEQIFYAADDQQKELCRCFADLLVAGRKFQDAIRVKYGQSGANLGTGMFTDADLARYDQGKLVIDGDTAQLTPEGQSESHPLKFKRVDDKWKLIVTDYAGATDANLPRQLQTLQAMTQALRTSAAEIGAGKYPTADEAAAAIQQKFHAVMEASLRNNPATTQSSGAP